MTPDRRAYVEANALALVESLEARVARQTAELARLNQSLANVRADRDRLRDALRAAWRVAADAVLVGASGTVWADLEESTRAALAASGITVGEQP